MERELWPLLYSLLQAVAQDFDQKYVQFQPWVIAAVWLWAALHDRHASWACDPGHWDTTSCRPARLPAPSTVSRRLYRQPVASFFRLLEQRIRDAGEPALLSFLDGKPLPVSGVSKDPDAKRGRGAGGMARGYKLHTLWSARAVPEAWEVAPLNEAEAVVARRLVGQAPGAGYLLADGNYDASPLFDAAARAGYQLVTPMPPPGSAGQGHHYQSPHRLRCIALVRGAFGRSLYEERRRIEQQYGNAVSFAGGLGPLPAWVRRLRRVRQWVWAKLLINGIRILKKQGLTTPLQ